jgi:hypothetical protein
MSDWYQEIIDCRGVGHKTGKGAAWATEDEARMHFEHARTFLEVPKDRAEFLLDLHNGNDDLIDTVLLDAAGFKAITGEEPLSPEEYAAYDRSYWREQLARRDTPPAPGSGGEGAC